MELRTAPVTNPNFQPILKASRLKPTYKRFVIEYLKDQKSKEAAIRAGFTAKNAYNQGNMLLQRPEVRAEIDRCLAEIAEHHGATVEYVIKNLMEIVERCMQKVEVLDSRGKPTGDWKFDSSGAARALELLGKYRQMFVEKTETNVNITLEHLVSGSMAAISAPVDTTVTKIDKRFSPHRTGKHWTTIAKEKRMAEKAALSACQPIEAQQVNSKENS